MTNETAQTPRPGEKHDSPADKWVKRGFLLAILLAVVIVGYFQWRGPPLGNKWSGDLEAALAKAKAQGRPVVVFVDSFPASATGADMIRTTLAKKNNKKALKKGNFLLVKVRLDRRSDWAKKYGVTTTPTMLVISPDGSRFHKREGKIGEVAFRREFLTAPLIEASASRAPGAAGGAAP